MKWFSLGKTQSMASWISYRELNEDVRVQIIGSFKVLSVSPPCDQTLVVAKLSGTGSLVVLRDSGRHAVCSGHVAVSAPWQHQTAAVTADIITGVRWILFLDGSLPQSTLGSNVCRWDGEFKREADASFFPRNPKSYRTSCSFVSSNKLKPSAVHSAF